MAKKKDNDQYLDVNASMQGTMTFSDPVNLRINGRFEGTLQTKGKLVVGEDAVVTADIEGEIIIVSGLIKGNIKASKLLTVTPSANISGDILAAKLEVQSGAVINSRIKMTGEQFSLPELADYLSVESNKIMEWVNNGKLPAQRNGGEYIFDRREVELWVAQNR